MVTVVGNELILLVEEILGYRALVDMLCSDDVSVLVTVVRSVMMLEAVETFMVALHSFSKYVQPWHDISGSAKFTSEKEHSF